MIAYVFDLHMEPSLLLGIIFRVTIRLSSVEIFSCNFQMQNFFNDKISNSECVLLHASIETSVYTIAPTQVQQLLTEFIISRSIMFYLFYFEY